MDLERWLNLYIVQLFVFVLINIFVVLGFSSYRRQYDLFVFHLRIFEKYDFQRKMEEFPIVRLCVKIIVRTRLKIFIDSTAYMSSFIGFSSKTERYKIYIFLFILTNLTP